MGREAETRAEKLIHELQHDRRLSTKKKRAKSYFLPVDPKKKSVAIQAPNLPKYPKYPKTNKTPK